MTRNRIISLTGSQTTSSPNCREAAHFCHCSQFQLHLQRHGHDDLKQVARELGVRYVLEGSVRRAGRPCSDHCSLSRLSGAQSHLGGAIRWQLADVFARSGSGITTAVATAIQPAIADAELRRILRKPPQSLGAWEAYQRGLWHVGKPNAVDNERAREFFRRAANWTRCLQHHTQ